MTSRIHLIILLSTVSSVQSPLTFLMNWMKRLSDTKDIIMRFDNQNTLKQAIANIKLESLAMPKDVEELLNRALSDSSITTEQVLELLRKHHFSD